MNIKGNHILIGLGGTGGKILKAFKMRLFEEFPSDDERKKIPVSLLYVDSTNEMMPQNGKPRPDFRVMGQDASFTSNEFFNIKAVDVEYILDHINNYPSVKGIVDNVGAVKEAIGSLGQAAGQKRRAGRLLFAANAPGYVKSLRDAYAKAEKISGNGTPEDTTIHIFAGLAGGTGSGSIIDAIVQARKTFPFSKILVYAMIPELNLPKSDMDQGRYYPNGYAAMMELNALQTGRWQPHDVTGNGPANLYNDRVKGVADGLTVYSNVNENGVTVNSLSELPKTISDFVFARIFYVNEGNEVNSDIVRAYNFENMDDFALEYDEIADPAPGESKPVARTKKINSIGIKRVMYPELRVLKHITYTIGQSVLWQFKFNNWHENKGFINEERNKDYRQAYLNKTNLAKWMLDIDHLTLNNKILSSDQDYTSFSEYWHDKTIGYADDAKGADNPLNELDNILADFFELHFREEGVEKFFIGKERVIPEMAREIRKNIETELFEKWKTGDISNVELKAVSIHLMEKIGELRKDIEEAIKAEKENYLTIEEDRDLNVKEWSRLGILQRMVNKGARLFAEHQGILEDFYISKTRLVALEFAKKLAAKLVGEIGKMDTDISAFGQKINEALVYTEKMITAQQKVNKGLEDMKGAIIEVCEEQGMSDFETDVQIDKLEMPNIARAIREEIVPAEFINFGKLAQDISVDEIADAFEVKLSELVRTKHEEKTEASTKVLGLNILSQLQQQLKTDDQIKTFAYDLVNQSGSYLRLNAEQIQLRLRNNETSNHDASINKKAILVSIPSPEDNPSLKRFADKLEDALKNAIGTNNGRVTVTVNRESPRKDELFIVTVSYCYPMRAIEWMGIYDKKYEDFLNTGNIVTDNCNSILLHAEGNGKDLPKLFAIENAEEIVEQRRAEKAAIPNEQQVLNPGQPVSGMPPMPGAMPQAPVMPPVEKIAVFLSVAGQQYGPFDYDQCKQMVSTGQLTSQTFVWMEGMASWQPASQVPKLIPLFAPSVPSGMPPMPPITSGMPPMPPAL